MRVVADDAARVASWRVQTEAIRSRYAAVVEESIPERLKLERLAGRSRSWAGLAAAATILAFVIGGASGWLARGASAASPERPARTAETVDAARRKLATSLTTTPSPPYALASIA